MNKVEIGLMWQQDGESLQQHSVKEDAGTSRNPSGCTGPADSHTVQKTVHRDASDARNRVPEHRKLERDRTAVDEPKSQNNNHV